MNVVRTITIGQEKRSETPKYTVPITFCLFAPRRCPLNAQEQTHAPLIMTLFGPMQVLIEGQPLPHMRSRKGQWLLALLTLRHGRPVEREWLAGTLWPDMEQSQAFANLRPILSDLRRAMGSETERLHSPDRHTLQLDIGDALVDVSTFDVLITSLHLSELEHAIALYRGPLLEGCTEEWVFQERSIREHQCLQALDRLGDAALSAGNYAKAADHYQRAIRIDPFWETAQRGLMETLAQSGDRNAALQVYRDFVKVLRDDPTAAPDKQTTALYMRLRAEARQPGNPPAETITQAAHPPSVTGYLPHPLTELVGREDECSEVITRLRRSRLVTLTGLGGIGKTRLALEVARQVKREYSEGVWLVALESLSEGKQVLPQIASVLGVKEEPDHPLQNRIVQHLQVKRLLLVLDNCEHLLEACSKIAQHLLQECVTVRILTTSREALGITGETVWTVPCLAVPDPTHLPNGQATLLRVLMGYESVQLFLERAQAVQKTFDLNGGNALAIAQLCFRLEGIPLALELAAARIKAMTVEQIVTRLDNKLGLLTYGSRTAQSRQQTLRATLDWSCALLTQTEQRLLYRLSVFAGGLTLEAAEQVCAGENIDSAQILPLLTSLVDKSLLLFEAQAKQGDGRYRLLEMVRQYAVEGLEATGETEQLKVRHRNWLVQFAEAADLQMNSPDQEKWLRRLEAEHDNIRTTLSWTMPEDHEETALQLVGSLWRFWEVRGHYSEGRQLLREA